MTSWETCWACRGSGMQDYGDTIGTCSTCHGDCTVRVRDDRGRFATAPVSGDPA